MLSTIGINNQLEDLKLKYIHIYGQKATPIPKVVHTTWATFIHRANKKSIQILF